MSGNSMSVAREEDHYPIIVSDVAILRVFDEGPEDPVLGRVTVG